MSARELQSYIDDEFDADDEDTLSDVYLILVSAEREYGLEVKYVTEIVALSKITEVPDLPPYIKGVINLRGNVIPVVDVRLRFNLPEIAYSDRTCVVITRIGNTALGLIVDAVSEVIKIPPEQLEAPPEVRDGAGGRFVKSIARVEDSVKLILELNNFAKISELNSVEIEQTLKDEQMLPA